MSDIDRIAALEQQIKDQAAYLDALSSAIAAVETRYLREQLEARLADVTPSRFGGFPEGGDVVPAGQSEPGFAAVLADGAVTSPTIASGALDSITKFASNIRPPEVVAALPTLPHADYPTGSFVYLTTDGKLYRNVADSWTASIGDLDPGSIDSLTLFASAIRPVAIVGSLPALPDSNYPVGSTVVLTTDGKLYRNVSGSWTAVVATSDLTGTITETQIADDAITTPKIAANAVTAAEIAADTITAGQIAAGAIGTDEIAANAVTAAKIAAGTITANEIASNTLTAGTIAAGAIGADQLAATIVLASLIKTAASGRRVEVDPNGIRLYDTDESLLVRIPTNGDPVFVKGEVQASSLISTAITELRGVNTLPKGSVTTVYAATSDPSVPPTVYHVAGGYYQFNPEAELNAGFPSGMAWDSASSTFYLTTVRSGTYRIEEYQSDGTRVRTSDTGLSSSSHWVIGVAVSGSYVYVLTVNNPVTALTIRKFNRSDLTSVTTANWTAHAATPANCTLLWDGSLSRLVLVTATGTGASKQVRFRRFDESLVLQSTLDASGLAINGTDDWFSGACVGESGHYWVKFGIFTSVVGAVPFNASTGAYISDRNWGAADIGGNVLDFAQGGIAWDGSVFWSTDWSYLVKFTTWDWTTETPIYWAGYSWYDDSGTTHETKVGTPTSITMIRRCRLLVQTPAIPSGGADDPNKVRIYLARSATQPTAGNYKLQATDAAIQRHVTYNAAGAADPASNSFPAGTAGEIKSAVTGWSLLGDGTASFDPITVGTMQAGTFAFPVSPTTHDLFYRTDLGMWFVYDGTRWLCTCPHEVPVQSVGVTWAISASTGAGLMYLPVLDRGLDIYIDTITAFFFVASGGSALGASHKWVGTLRENPSSTVYTVISIDSGSSNAYRWLTDTTGYVIDMTSSQVGLDFGWTKTGTPGNLRAAVNVSYRYIAT